MWRWSGACIIGQWKTWEFPLRQTVQALSIAKTTGMQALLSVTASVVLKGIPILLIDVKVIKHCLLLF